MFARLTELAVGLGVLASAGILAAMLLAPFLPGPPAPSAAPSPAASGGGTPAPSAEAATPPIGTYRLRGTLGFDGTCLGMILDAAAYPVALGAEGSATVLAWQSPIADTANPAACSTRSGELQREEALVVRVFDEDDPAAGLLGYSVRFHLRGAGGQEVDMDIVILAAQSSRDVIQALDMTTTGSGLVFERVAEIEPPPASSAP